MIRYDILSNYALIHGLDYNRLCSVVRDSIAPKNDLQDVKCIKTGCALIVSGIDPEAYYWGDLHAVGDTFIFNAVVQDYSPIVRPTADLESCHVATIDAFAWYFERRGVFVFPRKDTKLSDGLNRFLLEWSPEYAV